MASPYARAGGGGGSTSSYARTGRASQAKPKKKKSGGGGILGFAQNLGEDIGAAAIGLGPGLIHAGSAIGGDIYERGRHPFRYQRMGESRTYKKVLEPIGKSYAQTYGPLAHGDVSEFLHNLYEHPLGPILDVATVVTLGAGGAAKAGTTLSKTGVISKESRLAKLSQPGEIELRSPATKAGQKGPTLSKPTSRNPAVRARQETIDKLLKALPDQLPFVGETTRYARELQRLPRREAQQLRLELTDYNRAVKNLTNEEFAALHIIGRGVDPRDLISVYGDDVTMRKVFQNPKIQELVATPSKRLELALPAAKQLSDLMTDISVKRGILNEETALNRVGLDVRRVSEKLGREVQPLPGERFYVPDVAVSRPVSNPDFAHMGGGTGVQRSPIKQNKNVLFETARLAYHADLLGPEFLRRIKFGLFDDIHSNLTSSAIRVSRQHIKRHGLPEGYVYLRKKEFTKKGSVKPQKISHLAKVAGENERLLRELIPDPEDISRSDLAAGFGVTKATDAEMLHGDYLLVPQRLAKDVAGEFHRSNKVVRIFLGKPLTVWRALVLGLRPGYLVNNVVGQNLLYAIEFAGVDGLRAYLNAVKRVHGEGIVKTLIRDRRVPKAMREDFMREFFPEQVQSFAATQFPGPSKLLSGRKREKLRRATLGVMPATQALSETTIRRAAVEAALRKNPDFKRVYRAMPSQTRSFEAAARKALDENPHLQREVSDRVNKALGDYLGLGEFERNALRQILPFWAWYRAITTVTLKLALDTPGRADALAKLGQLGTEQTQLSLGEIEDYLRSAAPLGKRQGDQQRVLMTAGLNPFQTIQQLGSGSSALLVGGNEDAKKALLGLTNPFLAGGITAFERGTAGVIPGMVGNVGMNLPFARLYREGIAGQTPGVPTRNVHDRQTAWISYAGVPLRTLNLPVVHKKARAKKKRGR